MLSTTEKEKTNADNRGVAAQQNLPRPQILEGGQCAAYAKIDYLNNPGR